MCSSGSKAHTKQHFGCVHTKIYSHGVSRTCFIAALSKKIQPGMKRNHEDVASAFFSYSMM